MTNQLFGLVVAILAAVLIDKANAAQSPKDQWGCDEVDGVCLTSFKWCTSSSKDASAGCSSDGINPLYYNGQEATNNALVMWHDTYRLTWKNANPAHRVRVEWRSGDEDEAFNWSKEFPGDETRFDFTFEKLAKDMLENYDVRLSEIKDELSTFHSRFIISQSGSSGHTKDVSDQFVIFDSTVVPYSHMQTLPTGTDTFVKWGLGVGVAIGVGLVALLILAFFMGWHVGKRVANSDGDETEAQVEQGNGRLQPNEKSAGLVAETSDDKQERSELSTRKANIYYQ